MFNEQRTIGIILQKILDLQILGWQTEIIVVDDGSTDKTRQKIKPFLSRVKLLKHRHNLGKGEALKTAFKAMTGHAVVIQDADLEYEPLDLLELIKKFETSKNICVYGKRSFKFASQRYLLNFLGNRILTFLVNTLFQVHLTDLYTGYKIIPASIIKSVQLQSTGFEIEVEITIKILKMGYSIKEVPIHYCPRSYSEGKKIQAWDGFRGLWTIIKFRFN